MHRLTFTLFRHSLPVSLFLFPFIFKYLVDLFPPSFRRKYVLFFRPVSPALMFSLHFSVFSPFRRAYGYLLVFIYTLYIFLLHTVGPNSMSRYDRPAVFRAVPSNIATFTFSFLVSCAHGTAWYTVLFYVVVVI